MSEESIREHFRQLCAAMDRDLEYETAAAILQTRAGRDDAQDEKTVTDYIRQQIEAVVPGSKVYISELRHSLEMEAVGFLGEGRPLHEIPRDHEVPGDYYSGGNGMQRDMRVTLPPAEVLYKQQRWERWERLEYTLRDTIRGQKFEEYDRAYLNKKSEEYDLAYLKKFNDAIREKLTLTRPECAQVRFTREDSTLIGSIHGSSARLAGEIIGELQAYIGQSDSKDQSDNARSGNAVDRYTKRGGPAGMRL